MVESKTDRYVEGLEGNVGMIKLLPNSYQLLPSHFNKHAILAKTVYVSYSLKTSPLAPIPKVITSTKSLSIEIPEMLLLTMIIFII